MNSKVAPSTAGSHLPPKSRSPYFKFNRQQKPNAETETPPENGDFTLETFQRRYLNEPTAANSSVGNAISFSQTQAGFLPIVNTALDRMSELSVLCQDTANADADRAKYTSEFTQLQNFISDIGAKKFNGSSLFSGLALDVNVDDGNIPINPINLNATVPEGGLADVYDLKSTQVGTNTRAASAVTAVTKAIQNLTDMQAQVSSNLKRLNLSNEQLSLLRENLSAATNRINGLDLAKSFAELVRKTMQGPSGPAITAQANTIPQAAMRLLG